ncbi:alpha/beta hydrolase [Methanococcoides orientis]|uniref:alpha/beta hydrolase n=1 Tax=Methanococcoides orientis TaxID=2822137 RepID=UPI001E54E90E|nr:alpha/beta hydrolase [Methanococcoides orientis]UGV41341.1 alpha/beta hydrolase [Methanococcoides orientis]
MAKIEPKRTFLKRHNNIVLLIGVSLLLAGFYGLFYSGQEDQWTMTDDGLLSYPEREELEYSVINLDDSNPDYVVKTIIYTSREAEVDSLLTIPSTDSNNSDPVPAVVILPGAGVTKEGEHNLSVLLAEMGYASIVIDQRNLGAVNVENDIMLFRNGAEPVEFLMVYDALMASDVLRDQPEIDGSKIAMLGSSNGGRFAIIATSIDESISGVIGISTSGYDSDSLDREDVIDQAAYDLYISIDPDNYVGGISPRPFVMIHSLNDTIIPYDSAMNTFEKAEEPKSFGAVDSAAHGYTDAMYPYLESGLEEIFA